MRQVYFLRHMPNGCVKPEYGDPTASIILERSYLRIIKALINLHEENVRIGLTSKKPFVVHFTKKKKAKNNDNRIITLKANYFGVSLLLLKLK
jgi:hypothetical protein